MHYWRTVFEAAGLVDLLNCFSFSNGYHFIITQTSVVIELFKKIWEIECVISSSSKTISCLPAVFNINLIIAVTSPKIMCAFWRHLIWSSFRKTNDIIVADKHLLKTGVTVLFRGVVWVSLRAIGPITPYIVVSS